MISLSEIRTHLVGGSTGLKEVGTARDLGAAQEAILITPSAFIIPMGESASENRYATHGLIDQRVTMTFSVILALRDIGDRSGSRAAEGFEPTRLAVMNRLAALVPTGADSACVPRKGRLVSGIDRDGRFIWQDDFTVAFNRRLPSGA